MNYWLLKSEPDAFSIQNLEKDSTTWWDGVRNYQARNYLSSMMRGDLCLFYHSRCQVPSIVGICKVVGEAEPDPLAWDPESKYYDPKSSPENPRWVRVQMEFVETFSEQVSLHTLKSTPSLEKMRVVQKGSRLSVTPVEESEWAIVLSMGRPAPRTPSSNRKASTKAGRQS
jgi:predicted RNA-binding protein with PUA-like domain